MTSQNLEKSQAEDLENSEFNLEKTILNKFFYKFFNEKLVIDIDLSNAKDYKGIFKLFQKYKDEIFEAMGGDPYEADDLKDDIYSLEREIIKLEHQISNLEDREMKIDNFNNSVDNDYKIQYFNQYHKEYSCWEIEELLKNGKEYLKNKI